MIENTETEDTDKTQWLYLMGLFQHQDYVIGKSLPDDKTSIKQWAEYAKEEFKDG